jgi:hypothetical protein
MGPARTCGSALYIPHGGGETVARTFDAARRPLPLGQCSVLTGFIAAGPADVVRALGADLKPIVPSPNAILE